MIKLLTFVSVNKTLVTLKPTVGKTTSITFPAKSLMTLVHARAHYLVLRKSSRSRSLP